MEEKTREEIERARLARARNRTINLTLTGVLAGVYAVVTLALGPVSYGPLNLRFTNILIGTVPILGWPGVFGIALGVLLGNTVSPLGPIDLLSAGFSLIGLSSIHLFRKKSVVAGLAIYDLVLSLWVSYELTFVTHSPFIPTLLPVAAGITLVLVLAYFFYKALLLTGLKRKIESVPS